VRDGGGDGKKKADCLGQRGGLETALLIMRLGLSSKSSVKEPEVEQSLAIPERRKVHSFLQSRRETSTLALDVNRGTVEKKKLGFSNPNNL